MAEGRIWSTEGVPERERLSYWVDAVCQVFLELRVDSTAGRAFHGTVEVRELGPLSLNFLRSDDQHVVRSHEEISRGSIRQFQLIHFRNKPGLIRQFGREAVLKAGDCTLLDGRHPFTIDNMPDQDALSISLPADWLLKWLPQAEVAVAQVWSPGQGWGGVLADTLGRLTPDRDGGLPLAGAALSGHLGALLALAAGRGPGRRAAERASPVLLDRMRDTVRGACHDPSLVPVHVARHHGISLRYLHEQFAAAGTSFGAELLARRLELAERLLSSRGLAGLPMADVAARCGFQTVGHFARSFRRRFGEAPSRFRTRVHS